MLTSSPPHAETPAEPQRDSIPADICILGAGPGGLALAAAAAAYGQSVVLIEKHKMGGTSLNYGSMPAKALLASAERAQAFRTAAPFGIASFEPTIDRIVIEAQIREIVETGVPNASVERMTGLGVRVIQAAGRFIDPKTIAAGEHKIAARRFVIATGSSPLVPAIPGLNDVAYFTTETVFAQRGAIDHLIVIGGGAAGVEIAQAHRRLGARVTILDQASVLQRFDPELSAVVRARLAAEGVVIMEGVKVESAESANGRVRLDVMSAGTRKKIEGSHLMIACGRSPAIAGIGLEAAKIKTSDNGIKVNSILRTSNRRVFAIGDVTGLPHSTHRAEYHAGLLVKTLLFRQAARVEPHLIPASIHTDPEFATVGLSESEARASHSAIQVFRWPVLENARALANRATAGHIKVIADKRGRILGAALVCRSAGELVQVWALAISRQMTLDDMSGWIAPFPSLGDINRKAATLPSMASVGHAVSRRWVKLLAKLG